MTSARWPGDRRPAAVPDDPHEAASERDADLHRAVHGGVDTDGDGLPDTLLTDDGADLVVLTDLDGDGLADRVLHIGPDGAVHQGQMHAADLPDAVHPGPSWGRLVDDLFGPGG